jgi:hypothetical protein|tara:strand:- start:770 stop:1591 length:822 start_codon:yes stop_codon:yes gene_type:complete
MKTVNFNGVELSFDPDRHKYFKGDRELMGCSKLSEMCEDNGWRIPWAAKMSRVKAEELLKGVANGETVIDEINYQEMATAIGNAHRTKSSSAISIGNAGHDWLERYLLFRMGKGDKPNLPKSDVVKESITPFVQWAEPLSNPEKTKNPTLRFLAAEEVVYFEGDGFDYAGTLDLRFEITRDGKTHHAIGDFKTAKDLKRGYLWQLALYAAAVEQAGRKIDSLWLFKLPKRDAPDDKPTEWKMREIPFTDELRTRAPMLAAIKSMNFNIDKSLK